MPINRLSNLFSVFIAVLGIYNFGLSSKKEGGNNKEKTFERRLLMVMAIRVVEFSNGGYKI